MKYIEKLKMIIHIYKLKPKVEGGEGALKTSMYGGDCHTFRGYRLELSWYLLGVELTPHPQKEIVVPFTDFFPNF